MLGQVHGARAVGAQKRTTGLTHWHGCTPLFTHTVLTYHPFLLIMILMTFKARVPLLIALAAALALGGCGAGPEQEASDVQVAAAFYPLEFAVETIADSTVDVTGLTLPGVDAHGIELTPRQVGAVVDADLVVYLSGFQPAVDEAVKQADPAKVLDVADYADLMDASNDAAEEGDEEAGHEHEDVDPHFWLDPMRLATVTDAIAERLATVAPEQAATFTEGAAAARAEMVELDKEFTTGCKRAPAGSCSRPTMPSDTWPRATTSHKCRWWASHPTLSPPARASPRCNVSSGSTTQPRSSLRPRLPTPSQNPSPTTWGWKWPCWTRLPPSATCLPATTILRSCAPT